MMFAFARETAESALAGSPLHATLAMAHVERWLFFSMEGEDDDLYFTDDCLGCDDCWGRGLDCAACPAGAAASGQSSQQPVVGIDPYVSPGARPHRRPPVIFIG